MNNMFSQRRKITQRSKLDVYFFNLFTSNLEKQMKSEVRSLLRMKNSSGQSKQ